MFSYRLPHTSAPITFNPNDDAPSNFQSFKSHQRKGFGQTLFLDPTTNDSTCKTLKLISHSPLHGAYLPLPIRPKAIHSTVTPAQRLFIGAPNRFPVSSQIPQAHLESITTGFQTALDQHSSARTRSGVLESTISRLFENLEQYSAAGSQSGVSESKTTAFHTALEKFPAPNQSHAHFAGVSAFPNPPSPSGAVIIMPRARKQRRAGGSAHAGAPADQTAAARGDSRRLPNDDPPSPKPETSRAPDSGAAAAGNKRGAAAPAAPGAASSPKRARHPAGSAAPASESAGPSYAERLSAGLLCGSPQGLRPIAAAQEPAGAARVGFLAFKLSGPACGPAGPAAALADSGPGGGSRARASRSSEIAVERLLG